MGAFASFIALTVAGAMRSPYKHPTAGCLDSQSVKYQLLGGQKTEENLGDQGYSGRLADWVAERFNQVTGKTVERIAFSIKSL
ncbi:hypothetical protein V2P20_06840 [Methylobacter sp. Wu1]|uniref:hypothetical protein n=1 Tax=Methylobacter sp. Wu1 TaxID=3119359 RepID=UPI002F95F14E